MKNVQTEKTEEMTKIRIEHPELFKWCLAKKLDYVEVLKKICDFEE